MQFHASSILTKLDLVSRAEPAAAVARREANGRRDRTSAGASVALTFFAFLGFGVVTFTAKDLANPSRQLPCAMFLAVGIATVIYVAVALVCSAR